MGANVLAPAAPPASRAAQEPAATETSTRLTVRERPRATSGGSNTSRRVTSPSWAERRVLLEAARCHTTTVP